MLVGETVRAFESEGERRAWKNRQRAKNATGAGKKGSLGVVWKVLAGIEDGLDNGWPLIRADAGSLSFFSFPLAP